MSTIATTRTLLTPTSASTSSPLRPWIWPLPRLDGVAPCILTATGRRVTGSVEIGYEGRSYSASFVPVFAVQDGIVTYAGSTAGCSTLSLDHVGGWSTQYSTLEFLLSKPTDRFQHRRKQRVRSGDVIGYAPRSTLRIHFALSGLVDGESRSIDPSALMAEWPVLPWFDGDPKVPRRLAEKSSAP